MKTNSLGGLRRLAVVLILALLLIADMVQAQLPDCTGGNMMYAIFNNIGGSTTADSTEIRPVNISTGAVGNLIAGKRYYIRKRHPSTGTWYYGSASLGVDMITNRFYVMTQMSSAMQKDIVTIDPITGTMTVIGMTPTAPTSLNNYHFVKLAISNDGYGYAIGVHRDSTAAASTCNPLIRFTTCGATPTPNCSNIELLGYLPSTGTMYKWLLYNGDIGFDIQNNLYFATAAFWQIGATGFARYTDARLFRINASDIPTSAGSGTIPMQFVADYNVLDSTVINGVGFSGSGAMYMTTRRYSGVQTNPPGPSFSELYSSPFPGTANVVSGFGPITANFSVADLSSCYFPAMILGLNNLHLQYKYESSNVNMKWDVPSNVDLTKFEVQRSNDGSNFETIGTVLRNASGHYTYSDPQSGFEKTKYYRIKQVMNGSYRIYSNVINVSFNNKINLIGNLGPNPFNSFVEAKLWMKTNNTVRARIIDQSGRVVYARQFAGKTGDNKFTLDNLGSFKPGVYIVELAVQDDVIREKIIKQ